MAIKPIFTFASEFPSIQSLVDTIMALPIERNMSNNASPERLKMLLILALMASDDFKASKTVINEALVKGEFTPQAIADLLVPMRLFPAQNAVVNKLMSDGFLHITKEHFELSNLRKALPKELVEILETSGIYNTYLVGIVTYVLTSYKYIQHLFPERELHNKNLLLLLDSIVVSKSTNNNVIEPEVYQYLRDYVAEENIANSLEVIDVMDEYFLTEVKSVRANILTRKYISFMYSYYVNRAKLVQVEGATMETNADGEELAMDLYNYQFSFEGLTKEVFRVPETITAKGDTSAS